MKTRLRLLSAVRVLVFLLLTFWLPLASVAARAGAAPAVRQAGTIVGGTIDTDTTWTPAGSPFILKAILAPTLRVPHTAQKLHEHLGYEGQLFGTQQVVEYQEETRSQEALTYDHAGAVGTWAKSALKAVQALREPGPLLKKLDESVIEEEYARLVG